MSKLNRPGLTLIELLVVISILGVLTTLVAVYVLPAFSDNKNVIRGLDRVITTLLIAKQRALRDAQPVGVRFENEGGFCRRLRYIEQPEIFSGKSMDITSGSADVTINDFDLVGSGASPAEYEVQPGDWLRLASPPSNTAFNLEIVAVGPNTATAPALAAKTVRVRTPAGGTQKNGTYWLIRQPRPIPGEDVVTLPQNVAINLAAVEGQSSGAYSPRSLTNSAIFEVIFSPNGGVYSRATAVPLVLWVHDETADKLEPATARLIAIYARTGLVAAHEINQSGDPLAFALDGKNSGL